MSERFKKSPFRKFDRRPRKRERPPTTEELIKNFVIRNSRNGFFTKIPTLSFKFEIPQDAAWEMAGTLIAENVLEVIHDERTGDPKLCEAGKSYEVLQKEMQRRREKAKEFRKKEGKHQKTSAKNDSPKHATK